MPPASGLRVSKINVVFCSVLAVKKLSGNDEGCGLGVWKRGEGCEREGRGLETYQQQIFFFFFFLYLNTKPLFVSITNLL